MRTILWAPVTGEGLETLHLRRRKNGATADGVVLHQEPHSAFRLRYRLETDAAEHTRHLSVELLASEPRRLVLAGDGRGHWKDERGRSLGALDGCLDVDLAATPYTNTLPIRRLALEPGESATLPVIHVDVPSLEVRPVEQRYTCLARTDGGARWRYESLDNGFTVELEVDGYGLVKEYPGLFRRVT